MHMGVTQPTGATREQTHSGGTAHRPEIDGLRALAVLPVMLFHAGFSAFSGGYVGVDVFFVISGYLITTIIVNERADGQFSLVRFYERRARRILPALFLVMLACLPPAWLLMVPAELEGFGRSLAGVATFVSNVYFWLSSGYFDVAAEEKPLLHTWSLGVEEQYYLLFPLAIMAFWRFGVRRMAVGLSILAVLSFAASERLLDSRPLASFFLAPTRAWELFAGSQLAMTCARGWRPAELSMNLRQFLGLIGCALIVVPIFLYTEHTRFPGVNALWPVLGTSMILAFVTPETWVGRVLTLRPVLLVGLISYSAYLWHQPMLAFARLGSAGAPSQVVLGTMAAASLGLAYVSWRWVEAPFRDRKRWSRRGIFVLAGVGTAIALVIGMGLAQLRGVPQRWAPEQRALIMPAKTAINGCPPVDQWLNACQLGAGGVAPTIALVGDSHAYAIASALGEELARQGKAAVLVHTSCHPVDGIFDSRDERTAQRVAHCTEAHGRLREYIAKPEIEAVLLAVRWTARLYPMGGSIDAPAFSNGEGGVEMDYPFRRNMAVFDRGQSSDSAAVMGVALQRFVEGFAKLKPTVVLYPVPEVGWTPGRVNLLAMIAGRPGDITTSWQRFKDRNAAAIQSLDAVDGVRRVKPEAIFCNTFVADRCTVQAGGTLYYADDNHVSTVGAQMIVRELLRAAR